MAALASALLLALAPAARGHGGVSIDDDVCILSAGPYRAHFAGHLPAARGPREFCEDIPELGRAIIVLDAIDANLRLMLVDFRVLHDVTGAGNAATFADLGSDRDIEDATLYYRAPEIYPGGTVEARLNFDRAGRYIGLVTARMPGSDEVFRSVFPFSVGLTDYMLYAKWVVGILALGGGLYGFSEYWAKRRKQRAA